MVIAMKMAKASKDDIHKLREFFDMLEEFFEYGTYTPPNSDAEEDSIDVDAEKLHDLIEAKWNLKGCGVGTAWRRVVFGCDILIDNCTDPAFDTLEWRPDLRAFLESQQPDDSADTATEPQQDTADAHG